MSDETEALQHLGDKHGSRLLTVHTDGKRLRTPKKQEGIEWGQSIADGVDSEGHLLLWGE